ncbi:MAG: hypothetical protein WBG81_16810 [Rhodanobacter sp.]|jgi:hypothetical protein|uniref:hypothetical protein n=1 Tax=Rhodanobacter sp. KK11 TaxID=3083255 RepID=UPI002966F13F|nr:hypothetical protein [Rhodanobacter sp. KK11]MDW2982961.1 hypothetical protein [Rhodanobacter sp. KK11]
MKKPYVTANAVLWAAAVVAAAVLDAPPVIGQILLPWLAVISMLSTGPDACFMRGNRS